MTAEGDGVESPTEYPEARSAGSILEKGQQHTSGWRRYAPPSVRRGVMLLVLVFVLIYVVIPQLLDAKKSLHLLTTVNFFYLVAGVILEVAALLAYSGLTRSVLPQRSGERRLRFFTIFRINMSSLAVSHVLPGGTAPGTAVAYRLLTEQGVSGTDAGFALATQGLGSALVLNAILWVALVISIPLTGFNPLYGTAALVGAVLLGAFAALVYLLTRGQQRADAVLRSVARHLPFLNEDTASRVVAHLVERLATLASDRPLLLRAIGWAAANWLLDAASLWVFVAAFGHLVSPVSLLVCYGLANVLAALPITPGGLGVVEGVLTSTLVGFGTPRTVALLGVISYRLINFWLPIPVGGAAYLSLRVEGELPRQREQASPALEATPDQQDRSSEATVGPPEDAPSNGVGPGDQALSRPPRLAAEPQPPTAETRLPRRDPASG
jgi:uncharacterized protein (TIRG00374 family)